MIKISIWNKTYRLNSMGLKLPFLCRCQFLNIGIMINLRGWSLLALFLFLTLNKKTTFKEFFVSCENVMAFYAFLKTCNKYLIKFDEERIELMFNLDEIFFDMKLTIEKKPLPIFKTNSFL